MARRGCTLSTSGLFRACSENSPGGDRGYRGNQRVVSRPKKSSGLAKPSGRHANGMAGSMAPSPASWGSSTNSIGHWLFAEGQIHRMHSSDHALQDADYSAGAFYMLSRYQAQSEVGTDERITARGEG